MLKRYLLLLCLLGVCTTIWGQGKLLLVGGGNEKAGGWSDPSYQWAIQNAPNHRVAILSLEENSDWLQHYFQSLGADSVASFSIQTEDGVAEQQLIAALQTFDCWFFRDGPTKAYLERLRNQALGQALIDKYQAGGVIAGSGESMQWLSSVFYLPENEMPIAESCLKDIHTQSLQLRNDFLPFYRGFLFEARFSERGGLGSMLASLARWQNERQEKLFGLGLDDKTALCINDLGRGTVYGTGAASLFIPDLSESGFQTDGGKASIDSLRMVSLVHGQSFDFISWTQEQMRGDNGVHLNAVGETASLDLLFSGSNAFSENQAFLEAIVNAQGDSSLSILVVSSHPNSTKEALQSILMAQGVKEIIWLDPLTASQNDSPFGQQISQARKILFSGVDPEALMSYIANGGNGAILSKRIRNAYVSTAFMGTDSKLAGKCYIKNHETQYASYDGILKLEEGLQLLQHTILVPDVFWDPSLTENTITGLTYAMAKDSLTYGIWLPAESWGHYRVESGKSTFTGYGTPLLRHQSTNVNFAPSYEGISRNIVGYQKMQLSLLQASSVDMGFSSDPKVEVEIARQDWMSVYPNPVKDHINIYLYGEQNGTFTFQLLDERGRLLMEKDYQLSPNDPKLVIPFPRLPSGVYLLQVRKNGQVVKSVQLLH